MTDGNTAHGRHTPRPLTGRVVVVDIDGTVANTLHRQHLAPDGERRTSGPGWVDFHEASHLDRPVPHVAQTLLAFKAAGAHILFLTARPEWTRRMTADWLAANIPEASRNCDLLMRADDDDGKAAAIKPLALIDHFGSVSAARERVMLVLEDSERNAMAFEALGLPVLRVRGYGQSDDKPPG